MVPGNAALFIVLDALRPHQSLGTTTRYSEWASASNRFLGPRDLSCAPVEKSEADDQLLRQRPPRLFASFTGRSLLCHRLTKKLLRRKIDFRLREVTG